MKMDEKVNPSPAGEEVVKFRPNVLIAGQPAEEELIQTAIQRVLKIAALIGLAILGVWLWRK